MLDGTLSSVSRGQACQVGLRQVMAAKFPAREKRKAETHAKLIDAARDLFLSKGYDNTTLEEVAEHAGTHVQTLYRHFSSKSELAIAGDRYWLNNFKAHFVQRQVNAFECWRSWLKQRIEAVLETQRQFYRDMMRMQNESGHALSALWTLRSEYEDLLAEGIAADFDLPNEGVALPKVIAGAMFSTYAAAARRFQEEDTDLMGDAMSALDLIHELFLEQLDESAEPVRSGQAAS